MDINFIQAETETCVLADKNVWFKKILQNRAKHVKALKIEFSRIERYNEWGVWEAAFAGNVSILVDESMSKKNIANINIVYATPIKEVLIPIMIKELLSIYGGLTTTMAERADIVSEVVLAVRKVPVVQLEEIRKMVIDTKSVPYAFVIIDRGSGNGKQDQDDDWFDGVKPAGQWL